MSLSDMFHGFTKPSPDLPDMFEDAVIKSVNDAPARGVGHFPFTAEWCSDALYGHLDTTRAG